MKKVFFAVAALCAVLFCSCEKEENGGGKGSLVIDGVNLVGDWVSFEDNKNLIDAYHTITEDGIMTLYDISDEVWDKFESENVPYDQRGFEFSNGYLYGCTKDDFEKYTLEVKISVEGNRVIVLGIVLSYIKVIDKDTIIFYDEDDDVDDGLIWYRLKGFK